MIQCPFLVGPHITLEMVTGSIDMQSELFDMAPEPQDNHSSKKEELAALDEMFAASQRFRSSVEYTDMLNFICRMRQYSPFNCFLLYTQNPAVSYVATETQWRRRFRRVPKYDARPLVILVPFGPVCFVYDLNDTTGPGPVPEYVLRPFDTKGRLKNRVFSNTIQNCNVQGIETREVILGHYHGGSAIRITQNIRKEYNQLKLDPDAHYLILMNQESTVEDKYSLLVHELGHIFCGHLGVDPKAWWRKRRNLEKTEREIEAESVSFLVCRRQGLVSSSEKYLSSYRTEGDQEVPPLSLNAVFNATSYIEDMGKSKWTKPKKKGRYQTSGQ